MKVFCLYKLFFQLNKSIIFDSLQFNMMKNSSDLKLIYLSEKGKGNEGFLLSKDEMSRALI